MNQRVYDECLRLVTFSVRPLVWSVADIGEPGRVSDVESEKQLFREEAYQEIVRNVNSSRAEQIKRPSAVIGNRPDSFNNDRLSIPDPLFYKPPE